MNEKKFDVKAFLRQYSTLVTFVVMVIVATIATKGVFFSKDNLLNVLERASIIGIVALGQGICIFSGNIDLCVNSTMDIAFTSIAVLTHANGWDFGPAVLVALLIGAAVGVVNGVIVSNTNIPAWLVTLSTMMIVAAIALWWSGTTEIRFYDLQEWINGLFHMNEATSRVFSGLVWIFFGIVFALMLSKTRFGKNIYMVGGGSRAAYLSGTRTKGVIVLIYVISGLMATLAGIVFAYRVPSLNPTSAEAYQLYSIAAVYLGGASASGGEGSSFGTFFGALVLAMLTNVLNVCQVNIYIQNTIMGALLILIVFFVSALRKSSK